MTQEEKDTVLERQEKATNARRYCLTRRNQYWGVYDQREATEALFPTQEAAEEHIHQLMHGYDSFHIFPCK